MARLSRAPGVGGGAAAGARTAVQGGGAHAGRRRDRRGLLRAHRHLLTSARAACNPATHTRARLACACAPSAGRHHAATRHSRTGPGRGAGSRACSACTPRVRRTRRSLRGTRRGAGGSGRRGTAFRTPTRRLPWRRSRRWRRRRRPPRPARAWWHAGGGPVRAGAAVNWQGGRARVAGCRASGSGKPGGVQAVDHTRRPWRRRRRASAASAASAAARGWLTGPCASTCRPGGGRCGAGCRSSTAGTSSRQT